MIGGVRQADHAALPFARCPASFFPQADSVGARFVNASFSPETEAQAREMMRLVQLAFLRRLPALKWMTSTDKMKAADKLTGMVRRAKSVTASASERLPAEDRRRLIIWFNLCSSLSSA